MKTTTSLFKLITLRPPYVKDLDSNNNETDTSENSNSNTDTNTDNPEGSTPDNNESIQCSHVDIDFKSIISTLITMTPLANSNNLKGLSREELYKYLLYYFLSGKNRNLYLALIEEYTQRGNCDKDMFISIFEEKFKEHIDTFRLLFLKHETKKYKEKATKVKKLQGLLKKAIEDGVKKIEPNGKILVENREKMPILTELDVDVISVKEAKKEIKTKIALMQDITAKEKAENIIHHEALTDLHTTIEKSSDEDKGKIIGLAHFQPIINTFAIPSTNIYEMKIKVADELKKSSIELDKINDAKDRLVHLKQLEKNLDKESEDTIEKYVYKNKKSFGDAWDYSKAIVEEDSTDGSCVDIIDAFNHNREIEPQLLLDCANSMLKAYHKLEGKSKRQVTQAEIKNLEKQQETLVWVGSRWISSEKANMILKIMEEEAKSKCNSDFTFHIGDLRVIEHKTVGYLPDEIAHIDNTSPGEKNTRETRRLKRTDTYESLMTDIETVHETDTKSTDRFSLEKAASEVNDEQFHAYAGVKGSANFGTYKVSAFAGVDYTNATTTSNSMAQNISKELVEKTLDRVSKRVRTERSVRTIEEFEEKVTHCVDNTGSSGAKSYVYRWLNKISRVTLKNYGKRLILEINVPSPACYYMDYLVKEEKGEIYQPADPRTVIVTTDEGVDKEIKGLDYTKIGRSNYMYYADIYKTKLKAPPKRWITVSKSYNGENVNTTNDENIEISPDYLAKYAYVSTAYKADHENGAIKVIGQNLDVINCNENYENQGKDDVGKNNLLIDEEGKNNSNILKLTLDNEEGKLPIAMFYNKTDYGVSTNIEVECEYSLYAYTRWKKECYEALIKAYDNLKTEAESKKAMLTYELPTLNPSKKAKLITDELKKRALDCMIDKIGTGEKVWHDNVRKIESAYDWDNMSYELHPYYYAGEKNTDEWKKKFYLNDDDPTFEAFLQASYATLRIPLHRNVQFETFALESLRVGPITDEHGNIVDKENYSKEMRTITKFTHDADGNEIPEPLTTKSLGDFVIPTDLIILEAREANGVNVRSYPEENEDAKTDVTIEKFYSPGIVSNGIEKSSTEAEEESSSSNNTSSE